MSMLHSKIIIGLVYLLVFPHIICLWKKYANGKSILSSKTSSAKDVSNIRV